MKPAHFLNDPSFEHNHVRWAYEISPEQGRIMIRERPAIMRVPRVFGTKPSIVTAHEPGIRVLLKSFEIRLKVIGEEAIICIQENKIRPRRRLNPTIAGGTDPSVVLAQIADRRIALNDLSRVIRRAIIHNDYLEVRIALRQHALNGFTKKMGLSKTGNDDTDQFHF